MRSRYLLGRRLNRFDTSFKCTYEGAAIGRNGDSIDIAREKNRTQDAEVREHDQSVAALKQALADRGISVH